LKNTIYFFFIIVILLSHFVFIQDSIDPYLAPRMLFVSGCLGIYIVFKRYSYLDRHFTLLDLFLIGLYLFKCLSLFWVTNMYEGLFEVQKTFIFTISFFEAKFLFKKYPNKSLNALLNVILALSTLLIIYLLPKIVLYISRNGFGKYIQTFLTGFSGNKNLLSGFLLLLTPWLIAGIYKFNGFKRVFTSVILLSVFLVIYTLKARAVFVSIGATILYLSLLYMLSKTRWKLTVIGKAVWILPVIVLFLFIIGLYDHSVLNLIDSYEVLRPNSKTGTLYERLILWTKSITLTSQNWFFGVGIGNWKVDFPLVGLDGLTRGASGSVFYSRPHNDHISILSELGITGFFFYLGIWSILFYQAAKQLYVQVEKKIYSWLVLISLVLFFVFSFFSFPQERMEHLLLIAISIAFVGAKIPNHFSIRKNKFFYSGKKGIILTFLFGTLILSIFRIRQEKIAFTIRNHYLKKEFNELGVIFRQYKEIPKFMTPNGTPLHFYKGEVALRTHNYEEALLYFKIALKTNPGFLPTYSNIGVVYINLQRTDKAIKILKEGLKISSQHPDLNYNLALGYYIIQDFENAHLYIENLPKQDMRRIKLENAINSSGK